MERVGWGLCTQMRPTVMIRIVTTLTVIAADRVAIVAMVAVVVRNIMQGNTNYTWYAVALILATAVLFALSYFGALNSAPYGQTTEVTKARSVNTLLEEESSSFRQAQVFAKERKYKDALVEYEKTLTEVQDGIQRTQVQYKIAAMVDLSGDFVRAAELYRGIVSDTSIRPSVRAYAALMLGRIYHITPSQERFDALFSSAPWSSMAAGVQNEEALKRLFELSASIQPLALTEAYIAEWYAEQLLRAKNEEITLTSVEKAEYLRIVEKKLDFARTDRARIATDPNENVFVPPAAASEARALAFLHLAGLIEEKAVHDSFVSALELSTVYNRPGDDVMFRVRYAIFLLKVGTADSLGKIARILGPLTSDAYTAPGQSLYLRALATYTTVRERNDIIALAKTDPTFKNVLIELGWKQEELE